MVAEPAPEEHYRMAAEPVPEHYMKAAESAPERYKMAAAEAAVAAAVVAGARYSATPWRQHSKCPYPS